MFKSVNPNIGTNVDHKQTHVQGAELTMFHCSLALALHALTAVQTMINKSYRNNGTTL